MTRGPSGARRDTAGSAEWAHLESTHRPSAVRCVATPASSEGGQSWRSHPLQSAPAQNPFQLTFLEQHPKMKDGRQGFGGGGGAPSFGKGRGTTGLKGSEPTRRPDTNSPRLVSGDQLRDAEDYKVLKIWWLRPDSNRGPHHYE